MSEDEKTAVLIAEDEEINRTILREILKDKYRIIEAENGRQAVFCIQAEAEAIALIILDIHMPTLDGFGVMDYLVENGLNEKIPVIITTADESADVLVQGRKNKVADIVYKPFRAADIRKSVDTLVEICKLEQNLEDIIASKSEYLSKQYDIIKKAKSFHRVRWEDNILGLLDKMLPGSVEHSKRIRSNTEKLLYAAMDRYPKYGLSKAIIKAASDGSLMHDFGKLIIPDELFDKNDASASRALLQMKKRPVAGSEVINFVFANSSHQMERKYGYDICRYMYEQFDGKGYPMGLVGGEIPLCAQAVGLVHRYDELRHTGNVETPSKTVINKILSAEYRAYNPDLLEIFEDIAEDFE